LQNNNKHIIICGGGTGGHIFPAIAIANAIRDLIPDINILFVGAKNKIEMDVVPSAGYKIQGLAVSGFQRRLTIKNISFFYNLITSLIKSKQIINKFNPDLVLGVGGYASGPIMKMAVRNNIPVFIQEQNSFPGVTNRMLAKNAEKIFVAYDGLGKYFPENKILNLGNPVRKDIENLVKKEEEAFNYFGLSNTKKTVLFFGGSQGARIINKSIISGLDKLKKADIQVIWQTGKFFFKDAAEIVKKQELNNCKVHDFISRMDLAYSVADMVVCRAGAGTISELSNTGTPAILIPFPRGAGNHQKKNAMALVEKGAAYLIDEKDAENDLLNKTIELLMNEKLLNETKTNILKFKMDKSAINIAKELENFLYQDDKLTDEL